MSSNFDQGLHHLDVPNKDVEEELWSSPLMHYTSPFDDYKELFDDIENDQVFKFPDVSNGPMEDLSKFLGSYGLILITVNGQISLAVKYFL